MNTRIITDAEIAEKQQAIGNDFHRSQSAFSVARVRHLMGNTIIAIGERVHGRLEECRETAAVARKAEPARGM